MGSTPKNISLIELLILLNIDFKPRSWPRAPGERERHVFTEAAKWLSERSLFYMRECRGKGNDHWKSIFYYQDALTSVLLCIENGKFRQNVSSYRQQLCSELIYFERHGKGNELWRALGKAIPPKIRKHFGDYSDKLATSPQDDFPETATRPPRG